MYLKWTSQNLTSFANSLSLSHTLESSFVIPSYKYDTSAFELEVVCTDFIGKMISHRRESNAIRSPLNTCICYGHSLLPLLQDWQLQVSGGRGFSVLVKRLFYKLNWRDSLKKRCSPSCFAWARFVKQLQLTPF